MIKMTNNKSMCVYIMLLVFLYECFHTAKLDFLQIDVLYSVIFGLPIK